METAEIQASLQSPLFFRLVEDVDHRRHGDLIWASPVTLQFFFPLCVLKRCSPLAIFRAQAYFYRRHLNVCVCDLLFL